MPENKVDILQRLSEYDLTICPINALKNVASSYSIAIFQPFENITTNDNEVMNSDNNSITLKYNKFFEKVKNDGRELVLTPEYSCPWSCVVEQFDSNFPPVGALWVLGCESITIDNLKQIMEENSEKVKFIVENLDELDSLGDRNFLDPILYCFNATDSSEVQKKIVVIQFKRRPMVDHHLELEKDHLILGKKYYEIRNDEFSTRLITLICAEAIEYNSLVELEPQKAYIIPHLQLNINPYHSSFMDYRLDIFKRNKNIEVICVNWAKGFKIDNHPESVYGGSAYYLHSSKVKDDDSRINNNHKKGIYYAYSTAQHYHRYTLNYEEHIFYLKSNQISQEETANINQSRFGIESIKTFIWDLSGWIECDSCDDKWEEKLTSMQCFNRVSFLSEYSPIAKERFLNITTGASLSKVKWYAPKNLKSFHLHSDEKPSKLSVFFNPNNKQDLNTLTSKVHWLKRDILNQNIDYPNRFSDLREISNFTINEHYKDSHINIRNGESCATFVGLGHDTAINAKIVFSNIANAIEDDQRKLIVWYEDDNRDILSYSEENNKIDANFSENKNSITNDREGE